MMVLHVLMDRNQRSKLDEGISTDIKGYLNQVILVQVRNGSVKLRVSPDTNKN